MAAGLVREVADVFYLDREALVALERWGEKSADNLLEQLERARRVPLPRLLFALGIHQVGEATARLLAERFASLEELERATLEELQEVDGIGPEVAASIHDFFQTPENHRTIHRMVEAGLQVERPRAAAGPLAGKVFLFTGTLASMTRSRAQERVEALGGTAAEGLSARVSYLVAGEDPGAKLERARKLGVTVLTEDEFLRMVTDGP
jgi:DNA ligase (NAD+)